MDGCGCWLTFRWQETTVNLAVPPRPKGGGDIITRKNGDLHLQLSQANMCFFRSVQYVIKFDNIIKYSRTTKFLANFIKFDDVTNKLIHMLFWKKKCIHAPFPKLCAIKIEKIINKFIVLCQLLVYTCKWISVNCINPLWRDHWVTIRR